jgi:hypothetical protein
MSRTKPFLSTVVAGLVAFTACGQITWNPPVHVVNVSCCAFSDPGNGGSNVTIIPFMSVVKWVKTDGNDYTVTSGTGPADPAAGQLFNGSLVNPATEYSRLFNAIGTFQYHDSLHPGMTGSVQVIPQAIVIYAGFGCQSSNGNELTFANNSFPTIGNAGFALWFGGALPGAQCWIFMAASLTSSPLAVYPGCEALLNLTSLNAYMAAGLTPTGPMTADAAGMATFPFPIPFTPSLGGLTVAAQGLVFDPGAPLGIVLSNALLIIVGG